MKVPYARKWQQEVIKLRQLALKAGLREETKWSKPCFTWQKKNVAIIIPLKETCALMFFKGALLKDPKHLLRQVGENSQSSRWIRFTSLKEIAAAESALKSFLVEAIKLAESGKKVAFKKITDYQVPVELQARLDVSKKLRAAFEALTRGRQKSWILHVAGAKQAKTRVARVAKAAPMILDGLGFGERTS